MERYSKRDGSLDLPQQTDPVHQPDHLLKVAGLVNQDAAEVWAQIWGEFRPHVSASGAVLPSIEKGFVPACGWPEFLERLWLLKHYLDSVNRICQDKH